MTNATFQIDQTADHDLRRRVRNLLWARATLRRLQVEVLNGVVSLSGTVRSFYEKQLATYGCQRVAGVRSVNNQLVIAD